MYKKYRDLIGATREENKGLNGIKKLRREGKLKLALKAVNDFLENFPKNKYAKLEKAIILSRLGFYKDAIPMLEKLEQECISFFCDIDKFNIYRALLYSYFEDKNYEGVIKLTPCVLRYKEYLDNYREFIDYYLIAKRELNILSKHDKKLFEDKYLERQIVSYKEKRAIGHIYNHLRGENETSLFDKNVDVKKLYYLVRTKLLEGCVPFKSTRLVDYYHFDYPNAGYEKGVFSNHIEVVALRNTNNIITMHPVSENTIKSYPLNKENIKVKKKISQVEKFNIRYKNVL